MLNDNPWQVDVPEVSRTDLPIPLIQDVASAVSTLRDADTISRLLHSL